MDQPVAVRGVRVDIFYHADEYRVPLSPVKPGERFKFTLENSRPTWHILLMSYILTPEAGATVPAGPVSISGVAYNDGSARLESVLVSVDRGQTWHPADFEAPDSPEEYRMRDLKKAFDEVLDHPDAAEALSHPALAQLLDLAAD